MTEALKPIEICLGNFIESMGCVEMVTGIIHENEGGFKIGHTGWGAKYAFLPPDVTYETYPIPLTEDWKLCFGIDKYDGLPTWIKYVHQVQNYFKWALDINLLETLNWSLLPHQVEPLSEA